MPTFYMYTDKQDEAVNVLKSVGNELLDLRCREYKLHLLYGRLGIPC